MCGGGGDSLMLTKYYRGEGRRAHGRQNLRILYYVMCGWPSEILYGDVIGYGFVFLAYSS